VKRTIEITIETEQVLQIYSRGNQRGWCRDCGCETNIAALDGTRLATGWNPEGVRKHLRSQGWHTSLAPDGTLWVCLTARSEPSAAVERAMQQLIGKPPDQSE
jgi:hypothetical protein